MPATAPSRLSIPVSLEFFPPKTDEQRETLEKALPALKALDPEYVSVTFGAGGSTLSYTPDTVCHLREDHGLDAAPHVSCMGGTRQEIRSLLDLYRSKGCRRIVALRGDLPSGMASYGDFRYASDLVSFIRDETGDYFHIEVAGYPETHPQADDAQADLAHFKRKVDAGANGVITQYFYNPDAYFRFADDARRLGIRRADRAGHHADHELFAAAPVFRTLRRRNPALGRTPPAILRRRSRRDPRIRRRRGDRPVSAPDRRRRPGAALLHAQPGPRDHDRRRPPARLRVFS